ncbi:MAG: hypothetical protein Q9227_000965 [Pyrenula ochraceoflavens]
MTEQGHNFGTPFDNIREWVKSEFDSMYGESKYEKYREIRREPRDTSPPISDRGYRTGVRRLQLGDDIWYANETAVQGSTEAKGEDSGSLLALEGGPTVEDRWVPEWAEKKASGGILSTSILAALNHPESGARLAAAMDPKPVGPLVAYGSDNESD